MAPLVVRMRAAAMRPHSRGFTLIELMVVVLLVGLVATFAVINLGGNTALERQDREARRLYARMDLAREEAVMRASSLGILFSDRAYQFVALRQDQWIPLEGDILGAGELPEGMAIDVEIDGLEVSLGGDDEEASGLGGGDDPGLAGASEDDEDEEDELRPQIFFLPGGEIVPDFTIHLLSEETATEFRIAPGDEQWLALSEHEF